MSPDAELDHILSSLAKPMARLSDTLLDLRQWAGSPSRAGSCVKAYFELVEHAQDAAETTRLLASLRKWLEARLSILVFNGSRTVCLETLPLALAGETDLAEFCHGTMQRLREDRCHPGTQIRVEFGFSQNFPTAA